jgi:hypothetical protein
LVNNSQNVKVGGTISYWTGTGIGGSGFNVWNNGSVGNYWSDYSGNGSYVIDENNVDHYPLLQPVDISQSASVPEFSWLTILPILLTIPIAIAMVRKRMQRNI